MPPLTVQEQYVKRAREMGIEVRDSNQVRQLLSSIKYCQLKFQPGRRRSEKDLAEELGVHETTIDDWRRKGYVAAASEIVLAMILDPNAMLDVRHELMGIMSTGFAPALRNIVRIASGVSDADGHKTMDRDAVNAFNALAESKIADAYLSLLFRGSLDAGDDGETLERAQKLLGETPPLRLDTIDYMDAEAIPVGTTQSAV